MISIIAINMTVIGLTSLAEMKSVIGVDYGRFLLRKYKVFGWLRVYYLLIIFAIINVLALFLMGLNGNIFRMIYFWTIVTALAFAIYYFFSYIIVESKNVKKQIYEQELLGLYYNCNEKTTYPADLVTGIMDGSRTSKKLSQSVIHYFDQYSVDREEAFIELFGRESMLYQYTKRLNKIRSRDIGDAAPYIYRCGLYGTPDISHEFFQLYRYSNAQDRWILTILDEFDTTGEPGREQFDYIRLSNFTRIAAQLNTFGNSSNLYQHKFLEHLTRYYIKACFHSPPSVSKKIVSDTAVFGTAEFYKFMIKSYIEEKSELKLETIENQISNILTHTNQLLNPEQHFHILIKEILAHSEKEELQLLLTRITLNYQQKQSQNSQLPLINQEAIRQWIYNHQAAVREKEVEVRDFLFGK
ncbi:hypothetical protein UFB30_03745 [Jeotgalibacillus sp. HH7-29]|uniref:Uncharacterized protein n=1 Tax=Jeotgalibacillus haloalkalitolerans TaxID=3104292 RepID=A0ABU5KJ84_9BACL|nr:hypothetical protein [Jeotgalibacillus sp. HH7-29]